MTFSRGVLIGLIICVDVINAIRSYWHAYNTTKLHHHHSKFCPTYLQSTRPYKTSKINHLSLWPNLMSDYDTEHGETLYGSEEALIAIHKHQNPENCSEAKYLISGGWGHGFGSRIHMEGIALALAMELGRVYLPHPEGDNIFWETKIPFCEKIDVNGNKYTERSLACFYIPPSKCTLKHALEGVQSGDINSLKTYSFSDFESDETELFYLKKKRQLADTRAFNILIVDTAKKSSNEQLRMLKFVPSRFSDVLFCSPLRTDAHHYWWRAVSATYLLRPNTDTLALLKTYSSDSMSTVCSDGGSGNSGSDNSGSSIDLSVHKHMPNAHDYKKCIAMFVRHGDKGSEMKLLDFVSYRDTSTYMWSNGMVPAVHVANHTSTTTGHAVNSPTKAQVVQSHHNKVKEVQDAETALSVALRAKTSNSNTQHRILNQHSSNNSDISNSDSGDLKVVADTGHAHLPGSNVSDHNNDHSVDHNSGTEHSQGHGRLPFNGTLFITTEDSTVLSEAERWGVENNWKIAYTTLFERDAVTASKSHEEKVKIKSRDMVHHSLEYISMLLNLQQALRCEAWVCTLASNSCRVIDELRCTVGAKCNRYFADLSGETCSKPPCLDGSNIYDFGL